MMCAPTILLFCPKYILVLIVILLKNSDVPLTSVLPTKVIVSEIFRALKEDVRIQGAEIPGSSLIMTNGANAGGPVVSMGTTLMSGNFVSQCIIAGGYTNFYVTTNDSLDPGKHVSSLYVYDVNDNTHNNLLKIDFSITVLLDAPYVTDIQISPATGNVTASGELQFQAKVTSHNNASEKVVSLLNRFNLCNSESNR